jgi:thiol:disulfide interchange protein
VRYQPLALTIFGTGLVLLAAAAILAAIAVWRSEVLPRTSAVLFATGMALFLPQFFSPAAVRIGHGILLAASSIILAAALWASASRPRAAAPPPAGRSATDVSGMAAHDPAGRRIPS